jgi:hypothetical protein
MISVIMLSVAFLFTIMLNVIMLTVVMLSVVAPSRAGVIVDIFTKNVANVNIAYRLNSSLVTL